MRFQTTSILAFDHPNVPWVVVVAGCWWWYPYIPGPCSAAGTHPPYQNGAYTTSPVRIASLKLVIPVIGGYYALLPVAIYHYGDPLCPGDPVAQHGQKSRDVAIEGPEKTCRHKALYGRSSTPVQTSPPLNPPPPPLGIGPNFFRCLWRPF